MLKNLKVRNKLVVSFGIVMAFYIIAVIAANIGLSSVLGGLDRSEEHTSELQSH